MEIPRFLANAADNSSLLDKLVKVCKTKTKDLENKELLNVRLVFDLDKKQISVDAITYQKEISEKEYNYFGNNPAAAKQLYAVREAASFVNYWTSRPKGVLCNLMEALPDGGELKQILNEAFATELFNEKGINTDAVAGLADKLSVDYQEKKLMLADEAVSPERILLSWLGAENHKKQKIVLVIPVIKKNNQNIVISQHSDYLEYIASTLNTEEDSGKEGICHVCGKMAHSINTIDYTSKLSRSSIGKVFATTNKSYSPNFTMEGHQRNYAMCNNCYDSIFSGERLLMEKNKLRIANEWAIVLFEPINCDYDQNRIQEMKQGLDFAFNSFEVSTWLETVKRFFRRSNAKIYEFHIVFYKTDGKSCSIRKTIENVSWIRFCEVINAFVEIREQFGDMLVFFSLSSIYHMIPVLKNKKEEQINIDRLLDFYAAIIKGNKLRTNDIFALAAEALDRGLNEMRSSEVRNYKNLYRLEKLKSFENVSNSNKSSGKEYYIRQITLEYLALFKILQQLNILDKEVFRVENDSAVKGQNIPAYIAVKEEFLEKHCFSNEAKGLFYLGVLMYQVGEAQRIQKHITKPVLDKVTYSGMSKKEIITFYGEIQDKLRQYSGVLKKQGDWNMLVLERYNKLLHQYWGNFEQLELNNDKANVFYLMSGYSSCVPVSNKNSAENSNSAAVASTADVI